MSTQFARKNLLRAPIRTQKTASPACRFTFKKQRLRTTIHTKIHIFPMLIPCKNHRFSARKSHFSKSIISIFCL